jgi:membrane-associated phospholipid phosphatase
MNDIEVSADESAVQHEEIFFHPLYRFFAHLFSYLFHPIFIPVYFTGYLTLLHPSAFIGFSHQEKIKTILIVLLNVSVFPLVTVLLLKAVGFVDSLYLRKQKDRIIPFIASGIFFFWAYTVFREQHQYPLILPSFIFGVFLASSAALIANIYFKISMHAIGMGGWLGVSLILYHQQEVLMSWPLAIVVLLAGLVCTSRLVLRTHHPIDVYAGLLVGLLTQFVAYYFVG